MHACKAQWSQGLKSLPVGADPCPIPCRSKGNTGTFVVKPLPHGRTERGLCRQAGRQRWAPRWRGAGLHLPFRRSSEALSSCSAARPRHVNREGETFLSRGRSSFIALRRRGNNPQLSPMHRALPSSPCRGASRDPAHPDSAPGAHSCSNV